MNKSFVQSKQYRKTLVCFGEKQDTGMLKIMILLMREQQKNGLLSN